MNKNEITFGTDGWRAIISDDFTFDNVKVVGQAIADYVKRERPKLSKKASELYGRKYGIVIGYDTRFLSEKYAELIACVLCGNGIPVLLTDRPSPTPSVSFNIRHHRYIGGVMITASHNPAQYNGVKYKGYFGGSVGTSVTDYMVSRLFKSRVQYMERENAVKKKLLVYEDIAKVHIGHIVKYADMALLKTSGLKVLVDSMNGTGARYLQSILGQTNNQVTTINANRDPYFGGRSPEPNEVHLKPTGDIVRKGTYDVCLATDGDADRLGVIAGDGSVVTGHKVMTLLLLYLLENRRMRGGVVQTICGTSLIDKIAEEFGLKTYETPVGFKYIGDIYIKEDILIGGEETGGVAFKGWLPERDGILSGLLILELIASRKKPLSEILAEIDRKYGVFLYKRFDLKLSPDKKKKLFAVLSKKPFRKVLGKKVVNVKSYDGFKFILDNGSWIMLRPSGTEPKLRIYSEGHSEEEANRLIKFGKQFAENV
ncbi:MAG: phosphoglucomutase/phosphomannomutase family protein [Candidatus Omnitrophica bacterium]|nr:phosphoglucomutase/phosphomannomutase family protein [Candidatus Omnitrophota bacterium]